MWENPDKDRPGPVSHLLLTGTLLVDLNNHLWSALESENTVGTGNLVILRDKCLPLVCNHGRASAVPRGAGKGTRQLEVRGRDCWCYKAWVKNGL